MFTTRPRRFVPSVYGDAGGAASYAREEEFAETDRAVAALSSLIGWAKEVVAAALRPAYLGAAPRKAYWLDKKGGLYLLQNDRLEVIRPYSKIIYFDASKRSESEKSGSELARILYELKARGMFAGEDEKMLLKSLRENSTEELYDYLRETRKAKEKKETKKETKKEKKPTTTVATTSTFVPSTYSTYTATPAAAAATTTTTPAAAAKKKKRKAPTPFFKKPWFPFAVGGVALLLFVGPRSCRAASSSAWRSRARW